MMRLHLNDLLGQEPAKRMLNGYLQIYPPPLLIFHGPSGVGKYSAAEAFVFQFLCVIGTGCGKCPPCRKLLRGEHADFIRFPDAPIAIGKASKPETFSIRWLLQTRLPYTPFDGRTRFVLFPNGKQIQYEAETALLKTLEDTPQHTRFILLVSDLANLKPTIISRGICIPFYLLPTPIITQIAGCKDPEELQCLGGSLEKVSLVKSKFYQKIKQKIWEALGHPLELGALEKWLLRLDNPKQLLQETELELSYLEVLDFFGLLLLVLLKELPAYPKISQAIFQFRQDLQLDMAGLPVYLVSRLFTQIHALHFENISAKTSP